jgi:hypothetical protein
VHLLTRVGGSPPVTAATSALTAPLTSHLILISAICGTASALLLAASRLVLVSQFVCNRKEGQNHDTAHLAHHGREQRVRAADDRAAPRLRRPLRRDRPPAERDGRPQGRVRRPALARPPGHRRSGRSSTRRSRT